MVIAINANDQEDNHNAAELDDKDDTKVKILPLAIEKTQQIQQKATETIPLQTKSCLLANCFSFFVL